MIVRSISNEQFAKHVTTRKQYIVRMTDCGVVKEEHQQKGLTDKCRQEG